MFLFSSEIRNASDYVTILYEKIERITNVREENVTADEIIILNLSVINTRAVITSDKKRLI